MKNLNKHKNIYLWMGGFNILCQYPLSWATDSRQLCSHQLGETEKLLLKKIYRKTHMEMQE